MNNHGKCLIVWFILLTQAVFAAPAFLISAPLYRITLQDKPLAVYAMPIQQALGNAGFVFYLSPYLTHTRPEIEYSVTNNVNHPMPIYVLNLPSGVNRVSEGQHICQDGTKLGVSQTCILRLWIDKTKYKHSSYAGPIVCGTSDKLSCSQPVPNQLVDQAVAHAPTSVTLKVTPAVQDGLQFDAATASIKGKPTRTGVYQFMVTLQDSNGLTSSQPLDIHVTVNLMDKPVFKKQYSLNSATPEEDYRLNLLSLLDNKPEYAAANQVHFRIDPNHTHRYPHWIQLDQTSLTTLYGYVPSSEAGQTKELTVIASSNTGGDSEPLTIQIPVAFDPQKKPAFQENIQLTGLANSQFDSDLCPNLLDPFNDGSLKIILDKVEPEAPWLSVSPTKPTTLTGRVPADAVGQHYQLTVYANTLMGGNSTPVTISLNIEIDPQWTPRFFLSKPELPILHPGQPYTYDFTSHHDVVPEFEDMPYTISLAKGYPNPEWLQIINNHLQAAMVPNELQEIQHLFVQLKNIPGGESEVVALDLMVDRIGITRSAKGPNSKSGGE
jgi:hypothetical protein